jgi:hypothetical protein
MMNSTPRETAAPAGSRIAALVAGASFHDAWQVEAAEPGLSALGQFLRAVQATPAWVAACMALRNRVVAMFGLKNLGGLQDIHPGKAAGDYQPGDRVGIFTLIENTPNEVLLGDSDKHLKVTLSVHRAPTDYGQGAMVTITTVVKVHNLLGRLYMLPVAPMHKLIAPTVMRAIAAPPPAAAR